MELIISKESEGFDHEEEKTLTPFSHQQNGIKPFNSFFLLCFTFQTVKWQFTEHTVFVAVHI